MYIHSYPVKRDPFQTDLPETAIKRHGRVLHRRATQLQNGGKMRPAAGRRRALCCCFLLTIHCGDFATQNAAGGQSHITASAPKLATCLEDGECMTKAHPTAVRQHSNNMHGRASRSQIQNDFQLLGEKEVDLLGTLYRPLPPAHVPSFCRKKPSAHIIRSSTERGFQRFRWLLVLA